VKSKCIQEREVTDGEWKRLSRTSKGERVQDSEVPEGKGKVFRRASD